MTIRFLLGCCLGLVSMFSHGADLKAKGTEPKVVIEHYTWSGKVPKGKKVVVTNFYGNLSSRLRSEPQVGISAAIQKIGDNPATPEFEIDDSGDVVIINVKYPNGQRDANGQLTGRVDLAVMVPETVEVEMETSWGNIGAKKHFSKMTARTDSGNISLGSVGALNAYSQTGDIKIDMYNIAWKGPQVIHTEKGDISAVVAQQAEIEVWAKAQSISHNLEDFKISASQTRHSLSFKLNDAVTSASFEAPKGNVKVEVVSKPRGGYVALPESFDGDIRNLPQSQAMEARRSHSRAG